ncbi:cell growth-regulating nucleolar protein [Striga asiatica]|uniref:Cell growth-regulating nucleolar protein n=1 Tax=Striga asiatica TaxID=4170 RepID=A0A5A7PW80_STRAF|nr:cell growth-regulating nucleolar protein [Striga asiatica]
MVWFQCDDCGDNLKKPKLANHFRQCSAFKLTRLCLCMTVIFQSASIVARYLGSKTLNATLSALLKRFLLLSCDEKYGPKGQTKASNGTNTKTMNDAKPKPEVDINVGLSERPPWFCSVTGEEEELKSKDVAKTTIKWKKLITSALKSNEDGAMKFKKLKKFVMKSLKESGHTEDKKQVFEFLEEKVPSNSIFLHCYNVEQINSSSRFVVDGKYVRLVATN